MKKKILLLIIVLLILGGIYFVSSQSYPVAFTNWQQINAKDFNKNYSAAIYYYQKAVETYDGNEFSIVDSAEVKQEVKIATMGFNEAEKNRY